jgi:DNA polymerase-4
VKGRRANIIHVDLDAFYASVELLSRPDLVGKPMAVGGGVVLSATYEARQFGVRSGMSTAVARRLCPNLVTVNGSFSSYTDFSDQVFTICADFTPAIEQISIDEAFLDVTGAVHLFGDAASIARQIRKRVREETRLPISAGVASTKFLAKVGSQVAKPDGLVVVDPDREIEFLHGLGVRMIWGVGQVTEKKLAALGITTIHQLAHAPMPLLEARFGTHGGRHLHALAWNKDYRAVTRHHRAKSVGAQSAIGRRTHPSEYPTVLAGLADRIASRLRKKSRYGRTVTLRLRFADMSAATRSITVGAPIGNSEGLHHLALELLEDGRRAGPEPLTLLGISVSNLTESPSVQMQLDLPGYQGSAHEAGSHLEDRRESLEEAVREAREVFGRDAVARASVLGKEDLVPDAFRDLAVPAAERETKPDSE